MSTLSVSLLDNEFVVSQNSWDRPARLSSGVLGIDPNMTGKEFKKYLQIPMGKSNALAECSAGRLDTHSFLCAVLMKAKAELNDLNVSVLYHALGALIDSPDQDALSTIEKLRRRGHELYLLSNTTPPMRDGARGRSPHLQYFTKTYFSPDVGYRKPEPEYFQHVLDDANLDPENCIFVDDKAENLEAAKRFGIQTRWHKLGETQLSEVLADLLT